MVYSPETHGTVEQFIRGEHFDAFSREYKDVIDRITAFVHNHGDWLDPAVVDETKEKVTAGFEELTKHLFDLQADHFGTDKAQMYGTAKEMFHQLDDMLGNTLIPHRQRLKVIVTLAAKAGDGAGELTLALQDAIAALKPPLSYSREEHGSVSDFAGSPEFKIFQKEYEDVIDRIENFVHEHADQLDPPLLDETKEKVTADFNKLKTRLFDLENNYFSSHIGQIYGAVKEMFHAFDDMLDNSRIPLVQSMNAVCNLADKAVVCSGGLSSELQDEITTLKRFIYGLRGATDRWKTRTLDHLILQHVKVNHRPRPIEEVHYANVYYNHLAKEMGVDERKDEFVQGYKRRVDEEKLGKCREHVKATLKPSLLAATLSDEYRIRLEESLRSNNIPFEEGKLGHSGDGVLVSKDPPTPFITFEQVELLQNIQESVLEPEYGKVPPHVFLTSIDPDDYGSPQVYTGARRPIALTRHFLTELDNEKLAVYKDGEVELGKTDEGRIMMLDNLLWLEDKDGEPQEITAQCWLKASPEDLLDNIEKAEPRNAQEHASLLHLIVGHVHDSVKAAGASLPQEALDKWLSELVDAMERRNCMGQSWIGPVMRLAVAFNSIPIVHRLLDAGYAIDAKAGNGQTILMLAAIRGHVELVNMLIEKRANKESSDKYGRTALILAAAAGELAVVNALIKKGAKKEARDVHGRTALLHACVEGKAPVAGALLNAGADSNAKDWDERNMFMLAALGGHAELVSELAARTSNKGLRKILRIGWRLNDWDKHGETAMHLAARNDKLDAMEALLKAGVSRNVINRIGQTPLMVAARDGKVEAVQFLIEKKASKNASDKYAQTALMLAALNRQVGTLKVLLDAGADKKATDGMQQNVLTYAAIGGNGEAVKAVLDAGVDINAKDRTGQTALMHAAFHGKFEAVRVLLEEGADTSIKGEDGKTALMIAAFKGHVAVARLFIQHGDNGVKELMLVRKLAQSTSVGAADRHAVNAAKTLLHAGADGVTALLELALQHSKRRLKCLIEADADKSKDAQGKTALIRAVEMAAASGSGSKKGLQVLKALLDAGADTEIADDTGKTARMYAEELATRFGKDEALRAFATLNAA